MLPAGTPRFTQTNSSNLVNAYKWTEIDEETGLAFLALYSGITDRAEPCESLKATSVFCLGAEDPTYLVSSTQLKAFRNSANVSPERHKRGIRGAYFCVQSRTLQAGDACNWRMVIDVEQSQAELVELRRRLRNPDQLGKDIDASVSAGSDALARIMAAADGFQSTAEENVSAHHYANVLFNVLRGGIFDDSYNVSSGDFRQTLELFNSRVVKQNRELLESLPERLRYNVRTRRPATRSYSASHWSTCRSLSVGGMATQAAHGTSLPLFSRTNTATTCFPTRATGEISSRTGRPWRSAIRPSSRA